MILSGSTFCNQKLYAVTPSDNVGHHCPQRPQCISTINPSEFWQNLKRPWKPWWIILSGLAICSQTMYFYTLLDHVGYHGLQWPHLILAMHRCEFWQTTGTVSNPFQPTDNLLKCSALPYLFDSWILTQTDLFGKHWMPWYMSTTTWTNLWDPTWKVTMWMSMYKK